MYCKHCGANIPDGSVFCNKCGKSQTGSAPEQAQSVQSTSPQQAYTPPPQQQAYAPPKKNIWLIVTICVLGALAVVALVFAGIKLFATQKTSTPAFAGVYEDLIESSNIGTADDEATPDETAAPTLAPTQAPTLAPTQASADTGGSLEIDAIMAAGFVQDIEGYLDQTWWASSGHEVANPYAEAVTTGYPIEYDLEYAEVQYIFDADTQTVTSLYQTLDGSLEETEWGYIIDPSGFLLYSFHRFVEIDGTQREIYSAFAVSGDKLYEVEVIDDMEVSNYIELVMYGP